MEIIIDTLEAYLSRKQIKRVLSESVDLNLHENMVLYWQKKHVTWHVKPTQY